MNIHSECVFDDEGKYFNEIDIEINQLKNEMDLETAVSIMTECGLSADTIYDSILNWPESPESANQVENFSMDEFVRFLARELRGNAIEV